MTADEAKQVLRVMITADGECSECAGQLYAFFLRLFPEHLDVAREVWTKRFPGSDFDRKMASYAGWDFEESGS